MTGLLFILAGVVIGGLIVWMLRRFFGPRARTQTLHTHTVFEQVRSVGRLVGMEVSAKEIATSTKGFSWLPPIILSQARVAMIFQFEKQYAVDLSKITAADVKEVGDQHYHLELPAIEGDLRLTDVTPYDIQAGRVLGLLDIIQVDAATQGELMKQAQEQAASLYTAHNSKHQLEAQQSVERQLRSFLSLFGVKVEIAWRESEKPAAANLSERELVSV
jgi:Protein of unknown function (DUF4230)